MGCYIDGEQYFGAFFSREDILEDGDYSLALEVGSIEDLNQLERVFHFERGTAHE